MRIIDGHIHLGNDRETKFFDLDDLARDLDEASADGAVLFAFPEDMYRIADCPESRRKANRYVLNAHLPDKTLYPFYFMWNDYEVSEDLSQFAGIKWHRHFDEPRYDYDDPRCREVLRRITDLNLPVLIEEEFDNTCRFVCENPELTIIIPHMGRLNGGTERMTEFFDRPQVYFDTSVAPAEDIQTVLEAVGAERVIFASDVSGTAEPFFNFTKVERAKVESLGLSDHDAELVFAANIEKLVRKD